MKSNGKSRIKDKAAAKGVPVYTTDMFDDAYKGPDAVHTKLIFDDPGHYGSVVKVAAPYSKGG